MLEEFDLTKKEYNYKPIPEHLELRKSQINGIGLFAKNDILSATVLGITHYVTNLSVFSDGLIRTPLGGFLNHSDESNCSLQQHTIQDPISGEQQVLYTLNTKGPILAGEELTLDYREMMPDREFTFTK